MSDRADRIIGCVQVRERSRPPARASERCDHAGHDVRR